MLPDLSHNTGLKRICISLKRGYNNWSGTSDGLQLERLRYIMNDLKLVEFEELIIDLHTEFDRRAWHPFGHYLAELLRARSHLKITFIIYESSHFQIRTSPDHVRQAFSMLEEEFPNNVYISPGGAPRGRNEQLLFGDVEFVFPDTDSLDCVY